MAVLRWRIPSFNRHDLSTTIDVENYFLTRYEGSEEYHYESVLPVLKELSDDDRRYHEWYFGNLVSDIYYVLYIREHFTDSEHESEVNETVYLDALCDEVDSYVIRAKDVLRRLDGQFYDISLSENSSEAISEDYRGVFLELLQELRHGIRDYGRTLDDDENSRLEILQAIESVIGDLRGILHSDGRISWSDDFSYSLNVISESLHSGRKGRALYEYGHLYLKMGPFYEQRFLLVSHMRKKLKKSTFIERRWLSVLEDSEFEKLFIQFRESIINRLETVLFDTLSFGIHLSETIVAEKIAKLRNIIAEIDFDDGDKNLTSHYFKEKGLKERTGACFAILQIEDREKELVAFSGVYDGSVDIARFFYNNSGTSGAVNRYRAFSHSFSKIQASDGFCSQFDQVTITKDVEFFFDNGKKSLALKEAMQKVADGVAKERMFSCCERKLLQELSCLPPLSTCILIVKNKMCRICRDGLAIYKKKLGITVKVAPPVSWVCCLPNEYNDYVTFARRIMNSAKTKSITSFP